ncbi:hypothetical protein [Xanthomonas sp. JAI131]|uniref:hypothetical protein n=1 Tax=Xanthomonas sp. JAI131 TaxID=2723067 RepID=UPI001C535F11|nr:hypothetical protein [Xanthomonas sp. JAI131]
MLLHQLLLLLHLLLLQQLLLSLLLRTGLGTGGRSAQQHDPQQPAALVFPGSHASFPLHRSICEDSFTSLQLMFC